MIAARSAWTYEPRCRRREIEDEVVDEVVDDFARHLDLERSRSAHTQRAYLGDVRNLLGYARRHGVRDLAEIDLPLLRSWLAALTSSGRARSTVARRAAAARAFLSWAARTGRIPLDPSARLLAPRRRATLPGRAQTRRGGGPAGLRGRRG